MPGIINNESESIQRNKELTFINSSRIKSTITISRSPSSLTPQISTIDLPMENRLDTSIDRLYDNICEMESSSNGSLSHRSFRSDGEESIIDNELCHLVGYESNPNPAGEITEEKHDNEIVPIEMKFKSDARKSPTNSTSSSSKKTKKTETNTSMKSSPNNNEAFTKPSAKTTAKKLKNSNDLGPFLLKQARDLIVSENPKSALKYAIRAAKAFEEKAEGKLSLDLVKSMHLIAAIQCKLGKYEEAINLIKKSIEIPDIVQGEDHALAKFSGFMQLGDIYSTLGQLEISIQYYSTGLNLQRQVLGEMDTRVGETCRYLAEAHVQALQFEEAENLCRTALIIHNENGEASIIDEASDRRLMGLICVLKGDHDSALEHLLMASMSMASIGHEFEVASIDSSIGDIYLSLTRYDETLMAYQKSLSAFKLLKGENHPIVASVYVRLADLCYRTGKFRDSRSNCEIALSIYANPIPGSLPDEIASGFADISAIYESMSEYEQALKLLQKALKIYGDDPVNWSIIAGIEAQLGVLHYVLGDYDSSYTAFKKAIFKLRARGEKKSAYFGVVLNQMGLACVQRYAIVEAAELFEEARAVLEKEYGLHHPETLGAYSNLAGTYDAMGRLDEAIELLEHVVEVREVKLGTANPDVEDEKRRLSALLKEAGKVRSRKGKSLEHLISA